MSLNMENININAMPSSIGQTKLFINNEFVAALNGKTFPSINPVTEKVIAWVAEASQEDVNVAVAAARVAFDEGPWPKMGGQQRARFLMNLSRLIQKNAFELAGLEAHDNGKPFEQAKIDVQATSEHFAYMAGWADKKHGKTLPMNGKYLSYTLCEPIGVCAAIIPWNFPLVMAAWKLAPALAMGNCIVLKAAEQTPLSILRLAELIKETGFPKGVVNIINGYGESAGAALASHMDVDKVAFTGSMMVGQKVMAMAASSNLKHVTLELGGKSAAIVMDDCDLDQAVEQTFFGLFYNTGQCCTACSRIFVQEAIYDAFVEKMTKRVMQEVVGHPFAKTTTQGPCVSKEQFDQILGYIKSGVGEGARVMVGGLRVGNEGYFIQPTVFTDVEDHMLIAKEEIFGPVMSILKFTSTEEVIQRANSSIYGLAAGVWTTNLDRANTLSRALTAGTVWINCYNQSGNSCPFGGYKMSGHGREKGEEVLMHYCQTKCVTMPLKNPAWL